MARIILIKFPKPRIARDFSSPACWPFRNPRDLARFCTALDSFSVRVRRCSWRGAYHGADDDQTEALHALNDELRQNLAIGTALMTAGGAGADGLAAA